MSWRGEDPFYKIQSGEYRIKASFYKTFRDSKVCISIQLSRDSLQVLDDICLPLPVWEQIIKAYLKAKRKL